MSSQVKCVVNAVVGVQPPAIWLEANSLKESGSCKFIRTEWTTTMKYNESHMNLPPWWNRWHVYTGDLLAYSIGTLNHCQKKNTVATAWDPQRPSGAWGQMRTSEPLQLAEDCSQVHSGSFVVLYLHWEMQVGYTTCLGCGWDLVCGGDAKGAHKVHSENDALLGDLLFFPWWQRLDETPQPYSFEGMCLLGRAQLDGAGMEPRSIQA